MPQAVNSVLARYAVFHGRSGRAEFWWWVLAYLILITITRVIDAILLGPVLGLIPFAPDPGQPLSVLCTLALLVPNLAVAVRRLHDVGRSGWWLLLLLIPLVGVLVLIFWAIQPGQPGPNEFGSPGPRW